MVWLRRAAAGFAAVGASAAVVAMALISSPQLPVAASGNLDHLVLSPATASITAGGSQAYQAEGYDASGNDLGNYTSFATFTLPGGSCSANVCTTGVAGSQSVTAEFAWSGGAAYGSATLNVAPGPLDRIYISPSGLTFIYAGSSQTYTAEGYDFYGNDLGSATSQTTFSIAPDGACTGASCTATIVGSHTVTATDNGKSASASLGVIVGPIATLTLSPSSASISAGGSVTYTATGTDQYGNSLGDVSASTTLTITPADGSCNQETHACTATVASTHTVTATAGSLSTTATLQVTPGGLDHIAISPANGTVAAGTYQQYAAEAYDQYGNDLGSALSTTTLSIGPAGTCSPYMPGCTATVPGSYTVTANDFGRTATASLTVVPGPPASLVISPASATAVAGTSTPFAATAVDSYGNNLGDVTANTTFTIQPDGACYPSYGCGSLIAGPHQISGQYQQYVFGQATLTVTAGAPNYLVVTGTSIMVAGGTATYHAQLYDQYKNLIGDVTSSTKFSIQANSGQIACSGNICSTTVAGNYGVWGVYSGFTGVASLQVAPASLDHIVLSPASATVTAGSSQPYVVEAYDQYSNDIGNQTSASTLTISPDGSCSAGGCTATKPGAHTVSSSDGGKAASASLTVNPGPLDHLSLTPASAAITAGGSQTYAVEGFDTYNNDLGSFIATSSFAISPDGSCSSVSCTATRAGAHTVTATSQGKSTTAGLTVNPGALAVIAVSPSRISLVVGQTQTFAASAADAYGNPLGAAAASWSLSSGTLGTIAPATGASTSLTASGSNTGTATLSATIDGITGSAAVSVLPAAPTNLAAVVKTTKVALTWNASAGDKSYNIYRGTSPTNLVLLKANFPSTSFDDNPGSGTFYYYVVAVGSTGLPSAPSNTVSATFK
jgi:hypothetical protein